MPILYRPPINLGLRWERKILRGGQIEKVAFFMKINTNCREIWPWVIYVFLLAHLVFFIFVQWQNWLGVDSPMIKSVISLAMLALRLCKFRSSNRNNSILSLLRLAALLLNLTSYRKNRNLWWTVHAMFVLRLWPFEELSTTIIFLSFLLQ